MSTEFERYLAALTAWSGVEARVRRGTENMDAARERGLQASAEGAKQVYARVQRLEKAIGRNVDDVRKAFAEAHASALLAGLATAAPDAQSDVTEARLQSAFTEHRVAAGEAVAAARRTAGSRPSIPVRPDAARSAGRLVVVGIVTVVVAVTIIAVLIGFNT
jgi:phosphoglycolate phosphatase-like HAD superfamily hydrolase